MEGNSKISDPQVTDEELVNVSCFCFNSLLSNFYFSNLKVFTQLLKEENIPGLTICSRNMEEEIMEELNKQFNEQKEENNDVGEEVSVNKDIEKVSLALVSSVENETENERKVRLGEMTPFGSVLQSTLKSWYNSFLHQVRSLLRPY